MTFVPSSKPCPIPTLCAFALLALLAAGSFLPAFAAEAPGCDVCGERITGRYYVHEASDSTVCEACSDKYPECPGCGLTIKSSPFHSRGTPVCSDCVEKYGRCSGCGDVLLGKHYRRGEAGSGGDDRFCERCMQTKPVCSRCGLPYPEMKKDGGALLCARCKKLVERCRACAKPLLGRWYHFEHAEGRFCPECMENRPRCDFCGRPEGEDGRELPDGRTACGDCNAQSVGSVTEALNLLAPTVRFLEEGLGMVVEEPWDLALVDNTTINLLQERPDSREVHELGLFNARITPSCPRPVVILLNEMPATAFLETAAHEVAHLWLSRRNPHLNDPVVSEGFAVWVSAKWLEHLGQKAAVERLTERDDPLYGAGYKMMHQLEDSLGPRAVMRKALTTDNPDKALAMRAVGGDSPWRLEPPAGSRRNEPAEVPALSTLLPSAEMEGKTAFLKDAVAIDPATLRARRARKPSPPKMVEAAAQGR